VIIGIPMHKPTIKPAFLQINIRIASTPDKSRRLGIRC